MAEKILKIRSFTDEFNNKIEETGFEIVTDQQIITISITNEVQCCEDWGLLEVDDVSIAREDPQPRLWYMTNAELIDIKITDTDRKVKYLEKKDELYSNDDKGKNVMFIDVITTKGVITFVAYNYHNGYYGHTVSIKSKQLTETKEI